MKEPVILRIESPAADQPPAAPPGDTADELARAPGQRQRFPLVGLWFAACLVMQIALARLLSSVEVTRGSPGGLLVMPLWLGTMWGGWAGSVWVCSAWRAQPILRGLALSVAAVWHILWMSQTTGHSAARYAVMLGSYAVAQGITFRLLGLARWKPSPLSIASGSPGRAQFAIADLIGLTAAVALLITAAGGYHPPGEEVYPPGGAVYWWGLLIAEVLLLAIATLLVMAEQAGGRWRGRWLRLGVVLAIISAAGMLAWLESVTGSRSAAVGYLYAVLLLIFWVWMGALASCGRELSDADSPDRFASGQVDRAMRSS